MISDNGTNLCAGEREIREAINDWNHQKIERFLQQRNIDWRFNPPGASHLGRSLLRDQLVSGEALRTLMAEVESVLNSRPLTPSSDSPADFEALTPNHLLLLRPNCSMRHLLFFLRMTCIAGADGDKSSTWQTYFGKDGFPVIYLLSRNAKNGQDRHGILVLAT